MDNSENTIEIDYYTDILCVWAWIAQPRLEELENNWGDAITVRHHFVDVFGDCATKIPARWGHSDGYEKFAEHVKQAAAPFEQAVVHEDIWMASRPRSSAQAHLVLRAAHLAAGSGPMCELALLIRRAFFVEARDISDLDVLLQLAGTAGVDAGELRRHLTDGSAIAALTSDLRKAAEQGVRGSPTWVLNEGRQVIYGNVGYRVLNANVEELINRPVEEASWC